MPLASAAKDVPARDVLAPSETPVRSGAASAIVLASATPRSTAPKRMESFSAGSPRNLTAQAAAAARDTAPASRRPARSTAESAAAPPSRGERPVDLAPLHPLADRDALVVE